MALTKLSERSLSSWIAIGMALTVLPLATSVVVDHVLLKGAVIVAFNDVATRYRDQIGPTHRLQIALWEATVPVEEYLDAHEPTQPAAYRQLRVRIETEFSKLQGQFESDKRLQEFLRRAEEDWSAADHLAADLLTHVRAPGDPHGIELADRFGGLIGSSADKLRALEGGLAGDLEADHAAVLLSYERSEWISGIAAGLSLLAIVLGIAVIMRIIVVNVEQLVQGARKFAEGDRNHQIDVRLPPELRDIADELNKMIGRIRAAEDTLADEARRDAMTGLANRRAFEEALAEAFARMRRLNEQLVLLTLDIDHFKKINDTYGHSAGDDVLRAIGQTLTSTIREVDKAFRVGGEEFAVLLIGTDIAGAKIAAERLRDAIARRSVATAGTEVTVTASVGIAAADCSAPTGELIRAADLALYAAKSGGRNRVVAADEVGTVTSA